jgi:peptide/nickel transport system permease protein
MAFLNRLNYLGSFIARFGSSIKNNKSLAIGCFIFGVILLLALFADVIAPYHYAETCNNCGSDYINCRYSPPSILHPFGTNLLGRDMLSRIIYGSRIALIMAFSATIVALLIGIPLGIISGYYGGKVDRLLTMTADSIYSFPSLLLAITLAIYLSIFGDLKIIAAVAFSTAVVYAPSYFRVIRSQVLQIKEETYIKAAKSIGAGNVTILLRYIAPNVLTSSIAIIPFNMTEAILTNAALAFLGLGIEAPTADWGYDVQSARALSKVRLYPWLIFFPGLMIFLLSFALSLIGDALNDKFNPLLRKRR